MRASRFISVDARLWLHRNHNTGLVPEELHDFYTMLTARGQVPVELLMMSQSTGARLFLQPFHFGLLIWGDSGQKNLDLP